MTANGNTRDSGKDPADAQIDQEAAYEHACELAAPDGPLRGDPDVDRVDELVHYLAYATGVPVGVDHDLRITADSGPEDSHWEKKMPVATGSIRSDGLLHLTWSSGQGNTEGWSGEVELFPVRSPTVSMGVRFEGLLEGTEIEHGGILDMSPEQARSLAACLIATAEEAEEEQQRCV